MHAFAPHGVYSLHIEGRILVSEVSGPWNKELIAEYVEAIGQHIQTLSGSRWAMRATVTKNGMHTPESYGALVEGIRRQHALGRVATAVILRDLEAPTLVESILRNMYADAGEVYAFFADEASATLWLEGQIAAGGLGKEFRTPAA